MLSFGKKYQFSDGSDNASPMSVCLVICQIGCNSLADHLCKCSKADQKSSSYKKRWNSLHMDWVAPDGG